MKGKRCCCSYRPVGANGGEGVGSTGEQPVPVHQQHPDVVLALLLWKDIVIYPSTGSSIKGEKTKAHVTPNEGEKHLRLREGRWKNVAEPDESQIKAEARHILVQRGTTFVERWRANKSSRHERGPLGVSLENCLPALFKRSKK